MQYSTSKKEEQGPFGAIQVKVVESGARVTGGGWDASPSWAAVAKRAAGGKDRRMDPGWEESDRDGSRGEL